MSKGTDRKIEVSVEEAARLVCPVKPLIDGTDNFPARYALNEACLKHRIPLVYGGVMRFQGQVSVFWPAGLNWADSSGLSNNALRRY